jgi:hypothetical protein
LFEINRRKKKQSGEIDPQQNTGDAYMASKSNYYKKSQSKLTRPQIKSTKTGGQIPMRMTGQEDE